MWFHVQFRALSAPFFFVNFADFWMADQLNSLVPALIDFQYTICFYITNNSLTMASDGELLRHEKKTHTFWCNLAQKLWVEIYF